MIKKRNVITLTILTAVCLALCMATSSIIYAAKKVGISTEFLLKYSPTNINTAVAGAYTMGGGTTNQTISGAEGHLMIKGRGEQRGSFDKIPNISLSAGDIAQVEYTLINLESENAIVKVELAEEPQNMKITYTTSLVDSDGQTNNTYTIENEEFPNITLPPSGKTLLADISNRFFSRPTDSTSEEILQTLSGISDLIMNQTKPTTYCDNLVKIFLNLPALSEDQYMQTTVAYAMLFSICASVGEWAMQAQFENYLYLVWSNAISECYSKGLISAFARERLELFVLDYLASLCKNPPPDNERERISEVWELSIQFLPEFLTSDNHCVWLSENIGFIEGSLKSIIGYTGSFILALDLGAPHVEEASTIYSPSELFQFCSDKVYCLNIVIKFEVVEGESSASYNGDISIILR